MERWRAFSSCNVTVAIKRYSLDIYVVQENDFQAKATLESIIENHDGEELVNLARKN